MGNCHVSASACMERMLERQRRTQTTVQGIKLMQDVRGHMRMSDEELPLGLLVASDSVPATLF